jgi:antitoxin HigA-1
LTLNEHQATRHTELEGVSQRREEFLKPMKLSAYALAKRMHVPVPRVNDIVLERRGITADTALRLACFFKTTEMFWLNLQDAYD